MQKNNPYRTLIVFAAINLMALGAWFYLFVLAHSLESDINIQNESLAKEEAKGAYVTEISQVLRETENERNVLDKAFVVEGQEALFLEEIENLATTSKVVIEVNSFEPKGGALQLGVHAFGTFSQNYLFLSLLESLPHEVDIDHISLQEVTRNGALAWEGVYEIRLLSYIKK